MDVDIVTIGGVGGDGYSAVVDVAEQPVHVRGVGGPWRQHQR